VFQYFKYLNTEECKDPVFNSKYPFKYLQMTGIWSGI